MSLAIATHIPFEQWMREDDRTIVTAFDLLDEQEEAMKRGR